MRGSEQEAMRVVMAMKGSEESEKSGKQTVAEKADGKSGKQTVVRADRRQEQLIKMKRSERDETI